MAKILKVKDIFQRIIDGFDDAAFSEDELNFEPKGDDTPRRKHKRVFDPYPDFSRYIANLL